MKGHFRVPALCLLLAVAARLPASTQLPAALAGALAAPLLAIVAGELIGARAAPWAGCLIALAPIHALASRQGELEAWLVTTLLLALWLLAALERGAGRAGASALGLLLGGLLASGVLAFAAVAIVLAAWLAKDPERREAAAVASGLALVVVAATGWLGVARSPPDFGVIPAWIPDATVSSVVRCSGASFTRVLGLEYQLLVPHARYVLPLTALVVLLMLRGAAELPARRRVLLLAGALVPFVAGAVLAVLRGRVLPLQASRLVAALPFVALLTAGGLASLRGARAWAAGTAVLVTLVTFLTLALAG